MIASSFRRQTHWYSKDILILVNKFLDFWQYSWSILFSHDRQLIDCISKLHRHSTLQSNCSTLTGKGHPLLIPIYSHRAVFCQPIQAQYSIVTAERKNLEIMLELKSLCNPLAHGYDTIAAHDTTINYLDSHRGTILNSR